MMPPFVDKPLPRILVFTEDCLNASHGTGALLLRYFEGYPAERLANVFLRRRNEPAWKLACEAPRLAAPACVWPQPLALGTRLWNMVVSRLPGRPLPCVERPPVFLPVSSKLDEMGFQPDVVFTTAFSLSGLEFVDRLGAELGGRVPVVQLFCDYFGSTPLGFQPALRRAVNRCSKLWAVTEATAENVRARTGRSVEFVPSLHLRLPPNRKPAHAEAGSGFRAITIGNFQSPAMLVAVMRLWAACRRAVPGLPPLHWYAHPESHRGAAAWLTPDVQWAGFLQGAEYFTALERADLLLAPVNVGLRAADDFARYSLPTRVTEPLAVGVPVVALASSDTALSGYLTRHELGLAVPLGANGACPPELLALIQDRPRRLALGQRAVAHARSHFDIEPYRERLWSRLAAATSQTI